MSASLGFDFGNWLLKLIVMRMLGASEPIKSETGRVVQPSCVMVLPDGEVVIGEQAYDHMFYEREKVVTGLEIKSHLGTDENAVLNLSRIFAKAKEEAELQIGEPIENITVTHPANFTDAQKLGLKKAAEMAGFKNIELMTEPDAAANKLADGNPTLTLLAIIDIGGGTADSTICEQLNGWLTTIANEGEPHLGGYDYTRALMDLVLEKYEQETGVRLKEDVFEPNQLSEFQRACEDAKILLGRKEEVKIPIRAGDDVRGRVDVTQKEYEARIASLDKKAADLFLRTVANSGRKLEKIDAVYGVGGPFTSPIRKANLEKLIGRTIQVAPSPQLVVAEGAALHAYRRGRGGGTLMMRPTTAYPLSVVVQDPTRADQAACQLLVKKNTPYDEKQPPQNFRLPTPDATSCDIMIVQGGPEDDPNDCCVVAHIHFDGLPKEPDGTYSHRITVEIWFENSIFRVRATDQISGQTQETNFRADAPGLVTEPTS